MSDRILQHDEFVGALKTTFRVPLGGQEALDLNLVEVSELITTRHQARFSIQFQGPRHTFLPQSIYRMEHPQLGEIEIFLVPIGVDEAGYAYEAVFNRMKE